VEVFDEMDQVLQCPLLFSFAGFGIPQYALEILNLADDTPSRLTIPGIVPVFRDRDIDIMPSATPRIPLLVGPG
jgi:hypothetical protein